MKTFLISMLACGIALAQTPPAPKKAAPPAAKKAAPVAAPDLLKPGTLKAQGSRSLQGEIHYHQGRRDHSSESRLGAAGRGSFLQSGEVRLL